MSKDDKSFFKYALKLFTVQLQPRTSEVQGAGCVIAENQLPTNANSAQDHDGQYHPTAEKLKVRKPRHRRTGSHGSGNFSNVYGATPKNSPMRERRVSCIS